jgi:hypothetical protein
MAILDNYNVRYNTVKATLEVNIGGGDWEPLSQTFLGPQIITNVLNSDALTINSTTASKGLWVNGKIVGYRNNGAAFAVKGLQAASEGGAIVGSYEGIFYDAGYSDSGTLDTRFIIGGNNEMDVEVQSPHMLRLTGAANDTNDGSVRICATTNVKIMSRGANEVDAAKYLIVDRVDPAIHGDLIPGNTNTSDVTLSVSSGSLQMPSVYAGGAGVKTYGLYLTGSKTDASTGDSNDAILRGSANNYSASDTNYIFRGLNFGINNRSGGTVGMLDNSIGCQNKGGGTARIINGLHVIPENYGTVSDEFGGIRVQLKNEGTPATLEYGVLVENLNNSLATKVTSALKVQDSGANNGFTTGLNMSGATLTNEIVFSNGTKVTVTGDTIVFTNAAGDKSYTITMST